MKLRLREGCREALRCNVEVFIIWQPEVEPLVNRNARDCGCQFLCNHRPVDPTVWFGAFRRYGALMRKLSTPNESATREPSGVRGEAVDLGLQTGQEPGGVEGISVPIVHGVQESRSRGNHKLCVRVHDTLSKCATTVARSETQPNSACPLIRPEFPILSDRNECTRTSVINDS